MAMDPIMMAKIGAGVVVLVIVGVVIYYIYKFMNPNGPGLIGGITKGATKAINKTTKAMGKAIKKSNKKIAKQAKKDFKVVCCRLKGTKSCSKFVQKKCGKGYRTCKRSKCKLK